MRTTIRIDDRLFVELKTRAAASGRTLGEVIDDALRAGLARRQPGSARTDVGLPTFAGGAPQTGVDLDDYGALLDLMDGRS